MYMTQEPYKILIEKAKAASKSLKDWHHHFFPPGCAFNKSSKYQIALEIDGDIFYSLFDEKPMTELEQMENLFFGRYSDEPTNK